MEKQIVVFELGKESFGIDISSVEGIVKLQEITKVPNTPVFVEGITNLRGSALTVIDLPRRFDLEDQERTNESRIVVTQVGNIKVGMIVSRVTEVLTIDETVVEPPPPMISAVNQALILGVAKIDKRLIILLDLEKALSLTELEQMQQLVN